jgi:erythrin-vacuolar iron transport family protein
VTTAALERSCLRQRVQPPLSGLMDGSLSTLAPIFAVVLATHQPIAAFFTGLATALGAGVSMAFSEGLSDTGDLTGRGNRSCAVPSQGSARSSAVCSTRCRS